MTERYNFKKFFDSYIYELALENIPYVGDL